MNRLSSTWDRVFGKLRSKRNRNNHCGGRCCKIGRRSFSIEPLEERTLLSVSPLGDETLLNTYTAGTQRLYDSGDAVAACADGGFVATWTSDGQDGSGNGVYAQRLDAGGAPLGGEFLVNNTTALGQQRSSVAAAADGSYVIVWDSYGQDGILAGIFGRRYDAQGQALGGEFQVNETSFGHQSNPAVACLDDGGFVVVWSGPGTGDLWGVFGRRFDADGEAVGGEFRINSTTGNMQRMAAVAALPECGFIVAWQSHGGQDGGGTGIFAQRFDADCDPVGGEFQANATAAGHQQYPAVAAAADGRFTIAWQSDGQDGSGSGIFAQQYNADGTPAGVEFQVNTYIYSDQECPAVAYNAGGGFAVSWSGKGPGDSHGVFLRAFDADGLPLGDEALVNETTAQWQQYSAVAAAGDKYAVAWSGNGIGDNDGVFFRRFGFPLSTSGIAEVSVAEDAADTTIDLAAAFQYAGGGSQLTYQVTGVTSDSLFDAVSVADDQLTLSYAADAFGSADVTIRATAPGGEFVETTFAVNVAAMNDAPAALPFDPIAVNEDPEQVTLHLGGVFRDVDDWFYGLRFEIVSNDNPALFTSARLSGPGDALVLDFAPESSGSANIVLRATDEEGLWAEATVPVTVAAVNDAPAAAAATAVLARQNAAPVVLDLSALFSDADDAVENLSYQIVGNDNPSLVAAQLDGALLTLSFQPGQTGTAAIVVRASDALGHFDDGSYHTIDATVSATNLAPRITGLLDAPDPSIEGATLHLTATGVIDDTAVTSIAFWRDSDHNDVFDPAVDQLLGVDAGGADGWAISVSSAGFGTGAQRYFAQATDEDSVSGNVATATGVVGAVAVLDDGAAGYVETGAGWTDNAAGGYLGAARRHAAGSGANTAAWTFDGLMPQPHEVFVTWRAAAGLASNARFSIYDGQQLLGTYAVDQRVAPDDVDEDGAAWLRLGEFTIANGRVTVVLSDAADGPVVADAVRLVDPPPTIESLSVTATVTRPDDVTLTAVNVADSDGTVVEVRFYRDTNGNAVLNVGVDELLGTDTTSGDGWGITAGTATFSTGTQTYFARAKDNAGLYSTAAWAQGVVEGPAAWGPASVYEGNTYTLQLDPTGIDITEWTIDWGDGGDEDVVSGSTRSLTHVYADDTDGGAATIVVTGTDGVDTYYANQFDVEVLNVAPYLSVSGDASVAEGALYTLNLSVDDPGADTIAGWTIDWGDGGDPEYFSGNPSSVTHYYADGPENYAIAATADDEDGTAWPTGGTAGALDYSFGDGGNATTAFSTGVGYDSAQAMAVDGNGKIILGGSNSSHDVLMARYNANGTLDAAFGDGGLVVSDLGGYDIIYDVAVQSDDKILITGKYANPLNGTWDIFLARYHADGTLDLSFGDGGRTITSFGGSEDSYSMVIQSDGKILVAGCASSGDYEFVVARYTADGRLDPSFSDDGRVTTDFDGYTDRAWGLLQVNNTILVVGESFNGSDYDFALARYDENGDPDESFGDGGIVTTPIGAGDDMAYAVAVQGDRIVVVGRSHNGSDYDVAIACYDMDDGSLDTTFNANGAVPGTKTIAVGAGDDEAYAVAVQTVDTEEMIVAAGRTHNGSNYDFAVIRCEEDGDNLDADFGISGIKTFSIGSSNDSAYAMVLTTVDEYEKILVAGETYCSSTSYDFALARLNGDDGEPDNNFNTGGKVTTDFPGNDFLMGVAVQADQKIVSVGYADVNGNYDFILTRHNADGTPDENFSDYGKQTTDFTVGSTDKAYAVAMQADQKIVAVGVAANDFAIARYTAAGELDTTFSDDGLQKTTFGNVDYARDVIVQSDNKIVVAGFTNVNGTNDFAVARYLNDGVHDGDLDTTFGTNGKVITPIGTGLDAAYALALQEDGKILVVGQSYNGNHYDFALVRYNADDGTLDDTFDGDSGTGNGIITFDFGYGDNVANDVAVQKIGEEEKILVAGYALDNGYYKFALARFNANGSLDTSFGTDGKVLTNFSSIYNCYGSAVGVQSDGKILVSGYTNSSHVSFAIARYTADGDLDTDFDGDGKATADFGLSSEYGYAMAMQADGRIVLGGLGHYDAQLVRYTPGIVPHVVSAANVAPTLSVSGNQTVVVDAPFTLTDIGTFTDPGFGETYSYTIDWGDGSDPDQWIATIDVAGGPGVATEGSFDGSHVYDAADVYTVTVTLDDGEEQDQDTFYITARTSALFTWDGGGADDYWTTDENWAGDVAPLPGDQLRFAGTVQTASENDFPDETVFESIEFAADGFSLSGNAITLTDSIMVNSAATNAEIYFDIALDGAIAVDVAADATLTIFGELYGGGSLTKTGLGTLVLAGTSTYTGGTTVSAGHLSYLAMDRDEHVLEGHSLIINLNPGDFLIGALQEPLTFSMEADPEPPDGLVFDDVYNRITWTPDTNWGGYCPTVCVTAANQAGDVSATQTIFIDVYDKNRAPAFTGSLGALQATEAQAFAYDFSSVANNYYAVDPDAADAAKTPPGLPCSLTYTLEDVDLAMYNSGTGPTISAGGVFSWTPSEAHGDGTYHFKVRVTDEGGLSVSSGVITIDVDEVDVASIISGPSLVIVDNRLSTRFRYTVVDPDNCWGELRLTGNVPTGASLYGGILKWDPSYSTPTGSYQMNVELYDEFTEEVLVTKAVTLVVGAVNGHTPVLAGWFVSPGPAWEASFTSGGPNTILVSMSFGASNPESPPETTTYTVYDYPTNFTEAPSIDSQGLLTWTIHRQDPRGVFSFTVRMADSGNPEYASTMTCYGRVRDSEATTYAVANDDFVYSAAGSTAMVPVCNGDMFLGAPEVVVPPNPNHGSLSDFYLSGSGWYCYFYPQPDFHGVATFTYYYPTVYDGQDPVLYASRVATVQIAVDPVVVDIDMEGEYGATCSQRAIMPENNDWYEQGILGVSRQADNQHDGIIEDDYQLRDATVRITNHFPSVITGYWCPTFITFAAGWSIEDYGGCIRAYREVDEAWREIFTYQKFLVTLDPGETLVVPLLLEGISSTNTYDLTFTVDFHVINIDDENLQGGLRSVPDQRDYVSLCIAAVDLAIGPTNDPMPETYEDDLPMVVAMNRDYDRGYVDALGQPVPDCTEPLPGGATTLPQNWSADDELVETCIHFPFPFVGTWKLLIPGELRVWNAATRERVESGVAYEFFSSLWCMSVGLRIEGLQPSVQPQDMIVVAQYTDAEGNPLGLPVTDAVKVEVVAIDLEIDWISEYDEATWAASMLINNDYDEGVTHPFSHDPISDNDRLHGQKISVPPWIVTDDDDLTAGTLSIDGPDGQAGRYWIEVLGEPEYAQYVLVWTAEGELIPRHEENALSIELDADAVDLLIEGLMKHDNELNPIRLKAHFIPDEDYAAADVFPDVTDEVMALVGVNGWTRDEWFGERGFYVGTATAGSKYDTFEQLAKNITGHAEDAFSLRATNPHIDHIEQGTVVIISKLLEILEERLRYDVVEAANATKAANFARAIGEYGDLSEKGINRIFGIGRPASKRPTFDCLKMIGIIMARGVIMELMPGEFDAMNLGFYHFMVDAYSIPGPYFNRYNPAIAREELVEGDWAVFYNNPNYNRKKGMMGAVNVITVGTDSYYCWGDDGGRTSNYDGWKEALRKAYEKQGGEGFHVPLSAIPGYDDWFPGTGEAGFIDVAKLAMRIFDHRKSQSY